MTAWVYVESDTGMQYSSYNERDNSRSVATISENAYNDVQSTQSTDYPYETEAESGQYSPYTAEERELLWKYYHQGQANN